MHSPLLRRAAHMIIVGVIAFVHYIVTSVVLLMKAFHSAFDPPPPTTLVERGCTVLVDVAAAALSFPIVTSARFIADHTSYRIFYSGHFAILNSLFWGLVCYLAIRWLVGRSTNTTAAVSKS